ncbi:hypothetical protein [Salibacterium sp. K-3]
MKKGKGIKWNHQIKIKENAVIKKYDEGFLLVEYLENASYHRKEESILSVTPSILAALCQLSENAGFEGYVAINIKRNARLFGGI